MNCFFSCYVRKCDDAYKPFFHMVSYTEEEEEEAFEEAPFSLSSAASFPDRKSLANIFFKPLGPFGSGLPFKCV